MTNKTYKKLLIIFSVLLILGLVIIIYYSQCKHNGVIEDGFPTTTPVQLASVCFMITN